MVNRTDRLYAIAEELRAVSPRPRSASWLAKRFEVSVRTIERDVSALKRAGTPMWAEPGRTGGLCLDRSRTLPPVNFTPQEAFALAVAIEGVPANPFSPAARAAHRKVIGAMGVADAAAARELASRVHVLASDESSVAIPARIADALSVGHVLRIDYHDRAGTITSREIEPLVYIRTPASGIWSRGVGFVRVCEPSGRIASEPSPACLKSLRPAACHLRNSESRAGFDSSVISKTELRQEDVAVRGHDRIESVRVDAQE